MQDSALYPDFFKPKTSEKLFTSKGETIIPTCIVKFEKWQGPAVKETFGGKPIVAFDNRPMFAELAIYLQFLKEGWNARWIETYGKPNHAPMHLTNWKDEPYRNQVHDPITDSKILKLLDDTMRLNDNSYSGCWDVLAWKGDRVIFAESKRQKKDLLRSTQVKWLDAGLRYGLSADNFLLVEWGMDEKVNYFKSAAKLRPVVQLASAEAGTSSLPKLATNYGNGEPITFHGQADRAAFLDWLKRYSNGGAFYLKQRSGRPFMIHRSNCHHLNDGQWAKNPTKDKKICSTSETSLRKLGLDIVECSSCM